MNNGIILVNKPSGYTSRDIVNIYQKKIGIKKIGHCGTLDPLAKGVLVLCVGNATKLVPYLSATSKKYYTKMKLGLLTTTGDLEGDVIDELNYNIDDKTIRNTFKNFEKKYLQEVPKYSAVKVNGKKLYEYARNNQDVKIPKRMVHIESLELLHIDRHDKYTELSFVCVVSKGTYIRSLCIDIAKKMNTVAVMSDLIREEQGCFKITECSELNEEYKIINVNDIALPFTRIDLKSIDDVKYGRKILNTDLVEGIVTLYYNNELIAFYESDGKFLKSRRGVKVWK
ncbi:MAG: tRNA pseudouridine(55) synthase TruB [Bacilli bacterium]